jgi:hypothetical protein
MDAMVSMEITTDATTVAASAGDLPKSHEMHPRADPFEI